MRIAFSCATADPTGPNRANKRPSRQNERAAVCDSVDMAYASFTASSDTRGSLCSCRDTKAPVSHQDMTSGGLTGSSNIRKQCMRTSTGRLHRSDS